MKNAATLAITLSILPLESLAADNNTPYYSWCSCPCQAFYDSCVSECPPYDSCKSFCDEACGSTNGGHFYCSIPYTSGICGDFLQPSATSVEFGVQTVGVRSATKEVQLASTAYLASKVTGISINGDPGFSQTSDCVGYWLPASEHCTIKFSFLPPSEGPRTATVTVTIVSLVGHSITIALSGIGQCLGIFNDSTIQWGPTADNRGMMASFSPSLQVPGLLLSDLAAYCGYDHFSWHQVVLQDPFNLILDPPQFIVPYLDPPLFPNRGASFFGGEYLDYRVLYWNEERPRQTLTSVHLDDHTFGDYTVEFKDYPSRPFLVGNAQVKFKTRLAGVLANGQWDELFAFKWTVSYSGITAKQAAEVVPGAIIEYSTTPVGIIEPGERQLLPDCRNCRFIFSDGFELGDTSTWSSSQ